MRRVLRLQAAVLTSVALFTGCDDSSSGPTATPSKTAPVAAAPDSGGAVKAPGGRSAKAKDAPAPTKAD